MKTEMLILNPHYITANLQDLWAQVLHFLCCWLTADTNNT